jgi:hypothetical protein
MTTGELHWVALAVFVALLLFVTALGFVAARWTAGDLGLLDEWRRQGRVRNAGKVFEAKGGASGLILKTRSDATVRVAGCRFYICPFTYPHSVTGILV